MHIHNFFLLFGITFSVLFAVFFAYSRDRLPASWVRSPEKRATVVTTTGKRGLIYRNITIAKSFATGSEISWAYNYDSKSQGLIGFDYTPMLYDGDATTLAQWDANASAAIKAGSQYLMAFNEPDQAVSVGGSNIDPTRAAQLYARYMQPYAGKAGLVSPSTSQKDRNLEWLSSFTAACVDCTFDYIAVRYWTTTLNATAAALDMADWISNAYTRFQSPIWVTEIGISPTATEEQTSNIMEAMFDWLDSQDYVHRYAWRYCADGCLTSNGGLSPSGETYQSFQANSTGTSSGTAIPTTTSRISVGGSVVSPTSGAPTTVPSSSASSLAPPLLFSKASSSARKFKALTSAQLTSLESSFFNQMNRLAYPDQNRLNSLAKRGTESSETASDASSCNSVLQFWSQAYRTATVGTVDNTSDSTTYIPPTSVTPYNTTLCDGHPRTHGSATWSYITNTMNYTTTVTTVAPDAPNLPCSLYCTGCSSSWADWLKNTSSSRPSCSASAHIIPSTLLTSTASNPTTSSFHQTTAAPIYMSTATPLDPTSSQISPADSKQESDTAKTESDQTKTSISSGPSEASTTTSGIHASASSETAASSPDPTKSSKSRKETPTASTNGGGKATQSPVDSIPSGGSVPASTQNTVLLSASATGSSPSYSDTLAAPVLSSSSSSSSSNAGGSEAASTSLLAGVLPSGVSSSSLTLPTSLGTSQGNETLVGDTSAGLPSIAIVTTVVSVSTLTLSVPVSRTSAAVTTTATGAAGRVFIEGGWAMIWFMSISVAFFR